MSSSIIDDRDIDENMAGAHEPPVASLLRLITNRCDQDSLLTALEDHINEESLTEIRIMVSYIMCSGFNKLQAFFAELERRKIGVKVIVTHQLGISDFAAVNELAKFSNVELRVFERTTFHSKAWLFFHRDEKHRDTAIIGSSNISRSALEGGVEINVAITRGFDGMGSKAIEGLVEMFNDCFGISTDWSPENIEQIRRKFDPARTSSIPSDSSGPLCGDEPKASNSVHWGRFIGKPQRQTTTADKTAISLETRFKQAVVAGEVSNVRAMLEGCSVAAHRNKLLNKNREWSFDEKGTLNASPLHYVIDRLIRLPDQAGGDAMVDILETLLDHGADPNETYIEDDEKIKHWVIVVPLISLLAAQMYYHVMAWQEPKRRLQAALIEKAVRRLLDSKPKRPFNALDINATEERTTYSGTYLGQNSALGVVTAMWDKEDMYLDLEFESYKSPRYRALHEEMKRNVLIPIAKELIQRGARYDLRPTEEARPLSECGLIQEAKKQFGSGQERITLRFRVPPVSAAVAEELRPPKRMRNWRKPGD